MRHQLCSGTTRHHEDPAEDAINHVSPKCLQTKTTRHPVRGRRTEHRAGPGTSRCLLRDPQ
ncbi:hypothetical protein E2C01_008272 [Portunus trituberculatus]|uniref:Uncharacterized protein n=1 Tax=Portunus trituberculatus TaxID=210409 RepID=A0A5B7D1E6_PORTR|nr:hypothetical protein [Portunus trituberculatus]